MRPFKSIQLAIAAAFSTGVLCIAQPVMTKFPAPQFVGDTNQMGRGIQRTMNLLSSSTPARKNTVRVLFYGQSITEQKWWESVAGDLRRRFPNANLIIENRAIGGHSSQLLVKTAEADLYPFYPDLLIFYVYGSHNEYENIIRRVRERTTAEIVMQNDHVVKDESLTEETDPAKLTPKNWDPFMNHLFLPQTAKKYGALLVDQREAWKHYLKDNNLRASALLKDGVHLNDHGNYVMAELVKPWLRLDPSGDDRSWTNLVRTFEVGKDLHWEGDRLQFAFEGNRLDAIAANSVSDAKPLEVLIDGQPPSALPGLRVFNRASRFPNSGWPCLLRVQSEAPLKLEEWTLTLTEVSDDLKAVKFAIKGSVTGDDGEGVSTNRFVSKSKRIVLEPGDWNLAYCRAVFGRAVPAGFKITWKVLPLFHDDFRPTVAKDATIDNSVVLAQGLTNGKHTVQIRGDGKANLAALRVYRPPGLVPSRSEK